MTCLLKWEPGATLPMHKHPEIEQSFVLEGSFYDHDGICRAGKFVWRQPGSFHETHSDEGAVLLAIYRKLNVFQNTVDSTRTIIQRVLRSKVRQLSNPLKTAPKVTTVANSISADRRIYGGCALCRFRCGCISIIRDGRLTAVELDRNHPTGR